MEIKAKRNDLLEREELSIIAEPMSNEKMKEEIAKQLGKDKELIVIKHIYPKFGQKGVEATAHVYDNKEAMKVEPKVKEKKAKEKKEEAPKEEEKKAEEAPAAEKKEEKAPVEEKKEEEKKVEEKPDEAKKE